MKYEIIYYKNKTTKYVYKLECDNVYFLSNGGKWIKTLYEKLFLFDRSGDSLEELNEEQIFMEMI